MSVSVSLPTGSVITIIMIFRSPMSENQGEADLGDGDVQKEPFSLGEAKFLTAV